MVSSIRFTLPRPFRALANEAADASDGPHGSSWRHRCQVRGAVVLTGRAISVPFRARRHRFATVSHGNSRPLDLGVHYYRCAAARMVRMGRRFNSGGGLHINYDQRKRWSAVVSVAGVTPYRFGWGPWIDSRAGSVYYSDQLRC